MDNVASHICPAVHNGRCKGTRKDGQGCTMHVNTGTSEYCAFHAGAALKSLQTERMALGPGRPPRFMQNGKQVMGSKGTGPGQRYMNLPPKEAAMAAQKERNLRGYGGALGAAVGPPKEYGEVGTTEDCPPCRRHAF